MDEVQSSMEKLNDDLLDIVNDYLDAADSVYDFWFEEADPPDETDLKERIENPGKYILENIENTIYSFGTLSKRFHDGIPAVIVNMIMRTLDHYGAELYDLHPHGWKKYMERPKESRPENAVCFVRLQGETERWYVFCRMWSD